MSWTDVLLTTPVMGLAACTVVLCFKHGSIFAARRAAWEAKSGWRADLLRCPLCLAVDAALFLALLAGLSCLPEPWDLLGKLPVLGLAAASLAVVFYEWIRPVFNPQFPETQGARHGREEGAPAGAGQDHRPDPGAVAPPSG